MPMRAAGVHAGFRQADPAYGQSNRPFEYSFPDDRFQQHYEAHNRLAAIIGYTTGIAVLISCLGLLGLADFSAEQRTKEIGIRKALGASERSMVALS